MIEEFDVVALTRTVPEHGLVAGDLGTVVMVHAAVPGHGPGVTIEFMTLQGETIGIATLPADAVRAIGARDMAHVREMIDAVP